MGKGCLWIRARCPAGRRLCRLPARRPVSFAACREKITREEIRSGTDSCRRPRRAEPASESNQLAWDTHWQFSVRIVRSKMYPRNDSATCLVLPEGIVEECRILFTFSLSCARACPEVRFIWRLHPIMSFDKLVRRVPVLGNLPSNIEISAQTFEEDIARSSWALYRGSTAVVTAAANGVTPIYLEQPGELSIDPLFEIRVIIRR
jgi:hypothetical protein